MMEALRQHLPPMALGVTGLVLGVIASLLFFMPVLGIPLSLGGVVFACFGLIAAMGTSGASLRWTLLGLGASLLALGINVAITLAPAGYVHDHNVPRLWQEAPDRPYAPPPARFK